jgi:pimeloyl-ACP methyl ester carboxylesterase
MAAYVATAERTLENFGKPAAVVAHSMGGMVGTALAGRRHDLVAALIYVAAVVPLTGQSFASIVERQPDSAFQRGLQEFEPGVSHVIDPSVASEVVYHDCEPEVAHSAVAALCPPASSSFQ